MACYRLPIGDMAVPGAAFEQAWIAAGTHLRSLVRDGFAVLVHCKGRLARAGTIAARLLTELGTPPAEAIRQVRAVRPGANQTRAHPTHVERLAPAPPQSPLAAPGAQRDRALGELLGLAADDALGTALQFKPRGSFIPLTDMVGGGPFSLAAGEWTDDTAMARADSLMVGGRLDEADLMARFTAWYRRGDYACTGCCFDIGITTRAALLRGKRSGEPRAGSTNQSMRMQI